jgi:hypothetical protein
VQKKVICWHKGNILRLRWKKQSNARKSRKKKTVQDYDNLSDSGKIESADDYSCSERTDVDAADDNKDDDDEGAK